MILKGSQRAGAKALAQHLLRTDENDHVTIHELRGFIADELTAALNETYAISRGTKCKQFLFSLSLNPPQNESVSIAVFEDAINRIETRLGLIGQPRAIVFHEKHGRRHAHVVWSRIHPERLKAINLSFPKRKLQEEARALYIKNGWDMPKGLLSPEARNPLNFTREEWQQAKRVKRDPRTIKALFQDCWTISDSLAAFSNAMEMRGFYLARGDRRGHVAVDWRGEVYALSRWVSVKPKDLRAKLGDPEKLPTVEDQKKQIADRLRAKLSGFRKEMEAEFDDAAFALSQRRNKLVDQQRMERMELGHQHVTQLAANRLALAKRFRKGLSGLWDRITGRHRLLRQENELQLQETMDSHRAELEKLIEKHLAERRKLEVQEITLTKRRDRMDEFTAFTDPQKGTLGVHQTQTNTRRTRIPRQTLG
jgi:hypothetical protein